MHEKNRQDPEVLRGFRGASPAVVVDPPHNRPRHTWQAGRRMVKPPPVVPVDAGDGGVPVGGRGSRTAEDGWRGWCGKILAGKMPHPEREMKMEARRGEKFSGYG
ncbi:hypothetical protein Tco_0217093 [Tanacetum coccineum]